jgi:hypothetical protein
MDTSEVVKMKKKNQNTVETCQKSNRKIAERNNIDTPNTQIHDRSHLLAWYRYFSEKLINLRSNLQCGRSWI